MKTGNILLVILALSALAANSVLCRLALGDTLIDPVSFTLVRLGSGILILMLILARVRKREQQRVSIPVEHRSLLDGIPVVKRWSQRFSDRSKDLLSVLSSRGGNRAAIMLFVYAICFSVAYLDLDTGTGALILFGSVQLTMIAYSLIKGQKLALMEWLGLLIAFAGFIYLVLPGLSTPSLMGFVLMTLAGIAWGFYTLAGKESNDPVADTAANFFRTWPLLLLTGIWLLWQGAEMTPKGFLLALISGAITSGLGYVLWYRVLRLFTATQAGVLQLLVPVIAAMGGVIFVAEPVTINLVIASVAILGGITLVIYGRKPV
ncbi:DMT family transporter [Oceanospirillum sediminis]|uniref:DMT family transporter n=1 Tax=Oceanospirillum sediminis TaxID=2760088 RepID=A0A839IT68_9GAMM|nr:DMT family transporter [Oceanospirillum sediminis]MBB1487627.1 DMT family transporter [Oceanospirillum sediminis]